MTAVELQVVATIHAVTPQLASSHRAQYVTLRTSNAVLANANMPAVALFAARAPEFVIPPKPAPELQETVQQIRRPPTELVADLASNAHLASARLVTSSASLYWAP